MALKLFGCGHQQVQMILQKSMLCLPDMRTHASPRLWKPAWLLKVLGVQSLLKQKVTQWIFGRRKSMLLRMCLGVAERCTTCLWSKASYQKTEQGHLDQSHSD